MTPSQNIRPVPEIHFVFTGTNVTGTGLASLQ